jgi:DNA mismatch repair protein MutL
MAFFPPQIDLLPEHLIDQIKAGEVIERPGNLIKEVLENAVDAGATKLELTLKNNGLDLIGLKDNGHGMRFNDLPLAFSRHATSKISRFEDLYKLHSFGFRGEPDCFRLM